jgi:hypothetical protein
MDKGILLNRLAEITREIETNGHSNHKQFVRFLKEMYKTIQVTNNVLRYGDFSPTSIFQFKDFDKYKSIKEYFNAMGENYNNIIGFAEIGYYHDKGKYKVIITKN